MASQKTKEHIYTLVVGLGVTGLSVVRYLRGLGESIVVVDSRDIPPGVKVLRENYPDVPVHTGAFDVELFVKARRIIVSPGVPITDPVLQKAKEHGVEITGDIDLFAHEVAVPVVGITGSNGKSTVTTLLTAMIRKAGINVAMGGNIGTPALDLLAEPKDLYVLELSSFQLETLQNLPMEIAVVLNVSADHLDRYESVDSYALSKRAIYDMATKLIVNRDDFLACKQLPKREKIIGFTLNKPAHGDFGVRVINDEICLCEGDKKLVSAQSLKLKGQHNIANALAALAMGRLLDLSMPAMLEALIEFEGLEHRTQWVAEIDGVQWFNDSKATNVGATIAAIKGLPGKHVLIAGGQGKNADFSALHAVAKKHLRAVILFGKDADVIENVLKNSVTVCRVRDMQAAVIKAAEQALSGDNVLLSPACASFDMYRNFEHRGNMFMQAVKEIKP